MSFRKIALGLLISAVCLYFVVRGVDWGEVLLHLSEVNPLLFLLSMALMLMAYFLMAWRWQHLLDPLTLPVASSSNGSGRAKGMREHESLASLYGKMLTGYFFNAFFPARAGDIVRAYLLGRSTGLRKTTILATIVIEKAFDGIALLLMLLLGLVLLPSASSTQALGFEPETLAWAAGAGLLLAVGGLAVFYRYSVAIARWVAQVMSVLPFPQRLERLAVRLVETFASGLHVFRSPKPLVKAALISLLVWVVVAVMFLSAIESFTAPFPPEVTSISGLFFMTALVNLGLLVPALPGNVGTYEALIVAALAFFRVDKELAVAFALIFHVGQLLTTLVVGLLAFWAQNLSLSELRPVEEAAEKEAAESLEQIEQEVEAAWPGRVKP